MIEHLGGELARFLEDRRHRVGRCILNPGSEARLLPKDLQFVQHELWPRCVEWCQCASDILSCSLVLNARTYYFTWRRKRPVSEGGSLRCAAPRFGPVVTNGADNYRGATNSPRKAVGVRLTMAHSTASPPVRRSRAVKNQVPAGIGRRAPSSGCRVQATDDRRHAGTGHDEQRPIQQRHDAVRASAPQYVFRLRIQPLGTRVGVRAVGH